MLGADFVIHTDPTTGEVTREHIVGFQHEGSFDTSLRIRSDGHRVEVSGNPSRYDREDNVFGFATVDQCMALYNELLTELGLPVFTKGDGYDRTSTRTVQVVDGARFSRVDLARNYAAGDPASAQLALKALSACGRRGQLATWDKTGSMIHWGSRNYARTKYYLKGAEMKAHGNKKGEKTEYRRKVRDWAHANGIIRFETELGRKLLPKHHLNGWVLWSESKAREIVEKYDRVPTMSASTTSYQNIAADLEAMDMPKARAIRAQHAALAWLAGENLRESMSKSAFYRVAGDLAHVGLDVKVPCDVSSISLRVRTVELATATIPDWYRLPRAA